MRRSWRVNAELIALHRSPGEARKLLGAAIEHDYRDLALALIGAGINVDPPPDVDPRGWLNVAVTRPKQADVVVAMLAAGAEPSGIGDRIWSVHDPLRMATLARLPDNVIRLLAAGASVDRRDELGRTALHAAAFHNAVDCMDALLDGGADIDALDDDGYPPLFSAINGGAQEAVKFLVRRGADLDRVYGEWGNALVYAAAQRKSSLLVAATKGFGATPV